MDRRARLSEYEALSFDCYGTLIDWESGIAAVLTRWAGEHGLEVAADLLLERYAAAEAREEELHPAARYPEILAASMRSVGVGLGEPVSEAESDRMARSVPDWPAFPDSAAALASLARHYRLIVLSNVDRESFAASNARLEVRFDAVVTAEDVGSYKPSQRNFAALIDTGAGLGIGPEHLLHVAQSLFHDHVPAKRRGLSTAWIDRRAGRPGWGATPPPQADVQPDWTFASMAELAAACDEAADV
jgi:putative hydrolase of the HAD superfamily